MHWKGDRVCQQNWFSNLLVRKVGDGEDTLFWHVSWVQSGSLKNRFDRLFMLSKNKNARVSEVGVWEEGVWRWKWAWRRILFQWE